MRKFLKGRRRYAPLVLVGVGSLAIMGAECQPEPVKPQPPASTGLSIEPTSHDFGNQSLGNQVHAETTFTVTNHGPEPKLVVTEHGGVNVLEFATGGPCAQLVTLSVGGSCTVNARFDPKTTGPKQASLGVGPYDKSGPIAWATLTGTATP